MQDRQLPQFRSYVLCPVLRATKVCSWQYDDKLLSAESAYSIFCAHALGHEGCGLSQHSIAGIVAIGVVESLEVVQIEHENSQSLLRPRCPPDFALHHL